MTDDVSQIGASERARAFPAPPAELDLLGASADVLARHGLPRRPDPEREPFLAERWAQAFGGSLSIVPARLESRPLGPLRGASLPDFRVGGWAGVGRVQLKPGFLDPEFSGSGAGTGDSYVSPATFVSAEWVMPETTGNPFDPGEYIAIWVGLDGFPEPDRDFGEGDGPRQVLRGGISAWAHNGVLRWSPFAQWFTSPNEDLMEPAIVNFPVESGDRVGVVVCVNEPRSASVFFANFSSNQGTSVALETTGAQVRSSGTTAEWIVAGGDPSTALPFTPVTFESCVAGSSDEVFHLTPDPVLTNMFELIGLDERGPDVTETHVTSPTSAVIEWIATPI